MSAVVKTLEDFCAEYNTTHDGLVRILDIFMREREVMRKKNQLYYYKNHPKKDKPVKEVKIKPEKIIKDKPEKVPKPVKERKPIGRPKVYFISPKELKSETKMGPMLDV